MHCPHSRDAARNRRYGTVPVELMIIMVRAGFADTGPARLLQLRVFADTGQVLELRPNCECCDRDLDPASPDVLICTFECTWCRDCAENVLHGVCPNCGGELVRRPIRPARLLVVHPPSGRRVVRPGCAPASAC